MKLTVFLIIILSLYLIYRLSFPKQAEKREEAEAPPPPDDHEAVIKRRFVLPVQSKSAQTPVILDETEKADKKEDIFAAETVTDEPNLEAMSIPLDETDDDEIDYEAEEAEELNRTLGHEAIPAEGIDYDRLQTTVKVVVEQPYELSEETAKTVTELENTDMFERLVSGDEGRANWVKTIVERHIRNTMPATENEISGTDYDYGNFDAAGYLS
jgi:hypothetical protein